MSLKDIFESIGNFFSRIWNYEMDGTIISGLLVLAFFLYACWVVLNIIGWFIKQIKDFKEAYNKEEER